MKKYSLLSCLLILIFGVGLFLSAQNINKKTSPITIANCKECKNIFPEANNFSLRKNFPSVYEANKINPNTRDKIFLGLIFLTENPKLNIDGYGGPMVMAIGINPNNEIVKIHIISHKETSHYIFRLPLFLKQFERKKITDSFILGKDIDAMTQATITSTAITKTIKNYLNEVLGNSLTITQKNTSYNDALFILIIFSFACLGIFLVHPLFKWLSLAVSLIYLGFIKANMFSVLHLSDIGLLRFPSLENGLLFYALIIAVFLTLLVFGNIYCGHICPFAAIQEIIHKIANKIKIPSVNPTSHLDKKARLVKYILLLTGLLLSFSAQNNDIINFEVFILFFTAKASFLGWILVATILIISFFHYRFWCKYLCPVGAFNGLVSRFSLFKIRADKKTCSHCGLCQNVCPTEAIDETLTVNPSECILCAACLKNCPQKCLTFSIKK